MRRPTTLLLGLLLAAPCPALFAEELDAEAICRSRALFKEQAEALAATGVKAVPGLIDVIEDANRNWMERSRACDVLALIGADARDAIPALREHVKRTEGTSCGTYLSHRVAKATIAEIEGDADGVVETFFEDRTLGIVRLHVTRVAAARPRLSERVLARLRAEHEAAERTGDTCRVEECSVVIRALEGAGKKAE